MEPLPQLRGLPEYAKRRPERDCSNAARFVVSHPLMKRRERNVTSAGLIAFLRVPHGLHFKAISGDGALVAYSAERFSRSRPPPEPLEPVAGLPRRNLSRGSGGGRLLENLSAE